MTGLRPTEDSAVFDISSKKKAVNYAVGLDGLFENHFPQFYLRASGKAIKTAVDATEILKRINPSIHVIYYGIESKSSNCSKSKKSTLFIGLSRDNLEVQCEGLPLNWDEDKEFYH